MARSFARASSQYSSHAAGVVSGPPFTISAWAYPVDAVEASIVLLHFDADEYFNLYQTNSGTANFQARDAGGASNAETGATTTNAWNHVVGVASAANSRSCRLNGGSAATSVVSRTPTAPTTTNVGGNSSGVVDRFNGRLAEVAVWNVVLDEAEQLALSKGYSPRMIRPQSLVAYWPLFGNDSPEPDHWKNRYDLTLTNAPTKADHPRIYYPSNFITFGPTTITTLSASPVAIGVVVPTAYSIPAIATPVAVGVGLPAATVQVIANASPIAIGVGIPTARLTGQFEVVIQVNGTERQAMVTSQASLVVTDALNEEPDTASFRVKGFTPREGHPVYVDFGFDRIFGGSIERVTQVNVWSRANVEFDLHCVDWTRLLSRRLVNAQYTAADTVYDILLDLIADNTSGFTTVNVDMAALDAVTLDGGIQFTDEPVASAISRLMKRSGGYWYIDADRDLHAFLEDTDDGPDEINEAAHEIENLVITTDISQVRTRVFVEGGGSQTSAEVTAGLTMMPVDDASWYASSGGIVKAGPQRITYTGKYDGGGGALVGELLTPTTAPTVTKRNGSGLGSGDYDYAVTFYDGSGETTAGPLATITTSGSITEPNDVPTVTKGLGGNLSAGAYKWRTTFVMSNGGETTGGSSEASATMDSVSPPSTIGTASGSAGGLVTSFKYTFTNGSVETTPSPASNEVSSFASSNNPKMARAGCQDAPAGFERQFYRTEDEGSVYKKMPGPSEGFQNDDATHFIGSVVDGSLGDDAPSSNTATYRKATLNGIPISGDPNVTARKLYRTEAGGSTFKLVATINDNSTTSYEDNVADASLGATIPGSSTAVYQSASLINIPVGPSGTSGRRVYRTAVGAAQLKLLTDIGNNSTTTYTDTTADGSLGDVVPTSNTSGLTSPAGTINAGATTLLVTGISPFRAAGGWVHVGGQYILYTGISGSTLTGVPASGAGSIASTLNYGSEILATPTIFGVPASGAGAIQYDIADGEAVNVVAQVDDAAAQATLAALEGGDGIHEHVIQDNRLSLDAAQARGEAEIARFKNALVTVAYEVRDMAHRSGKTVTFDLDDPTNLAGDFTIQRVTWTDFLPLQYPKAAVEASSVRFSLEDLLRRALVRDDA